jgi:UDP-glucuronate 4-epimerase
MAPMLFADAILNDRAIKVFNHGNMSRDFTYVDDIVDGVIKVVDNPANSSQEFNPENANPSMSSAPYRIYNIGNNTPVQLLDFIETLEIKIGIKAKKDFMDMQDGDVVSTYADTNDLIKDFNYKPDTKLADGIEQFVVWYKDFYFKEEK